MICDKCKTVPAPKCAEECESPNNCPCQHREAEMLGDGTHAPKGVRKDIMR